LSASFLIGALQAFCFMPGIEAAALNHEAGNHTMENGVVVVAGGDVVEEILADKGAFSASTSMAMTPKLVCSLIMVFLSRE
jgi:hypothetical protein